MRETLAASYRKVVAFFADHKKTRQLLVAAVFLFFIIMVIYTVLFAAPANYSSDTLFRVKKGTTLAEVASQLKEKHLINFANLFVGIARIYKNDGTVVAGEYSFSEPQSILVIARRLVEGDFELAPVRVRVLDGLSALQISQQLHRELPDFDADSFYTLALPKEGRLFPDTYFFLPGQDPELVVSAMEDNFTAHIRAVEVATPIGAFGKSLDEVLTMASLLEREAPLTQDRRIIAGVLWRRIEIGMMLQVDAVFPYIIGKNSFNLTKADLLTDSPYNTYTNKGLPPGPIGNPSIDAIVAAVTPIKTNYLYYLSGRDGKMYYSATYAQHLEKKRKYLD